MKIVTVNLLLCLICIIYAKKGFGPGNQEWGYLTVRPDAELFWWLYYTTADVQNYYDRPLIIWLQGGPGASGTGFGNFGELGPLDKELNERNYTWINDVNVLFVDNPVGTGFSYVKSFEQLTKNNTQIAEDFLVFIQEFYNVLPNMKQAPLYIVSESYGGKMAAEIALLLHKAYQDGNLEVDVKGIGLCDSWISPIDEVLAWPSYLLNLGFLDQSGYEEVNKNSLLTKKYIDEGNYLKAQEQFIATEIAILKITHGVDFYNVLEKIDDNSILAKIIRPGETDLLIKKLDAIMNEKVKKELNLKTSWMAQSEKVFQAQAEDFMKPVTHIVEELLNNTNIKVFVFNGQLDLIVNTPGVVKWIDNLKWYNKDVWQSAQRNVFAVNGTIEGFYKKVDNFALYWVNRAGHMVPLDNPKAMDYILRDLTSDFDTWNK